MRTLRPGLGLLLGGVTAALVAASPATAQQTNPYPMTLYFGTGLIHTPVAWVAPRNADVFFQSSAKRVPFWPEPDEMNFATEWNTQISLETHWFGRFTVGIAAYDQDPDWGFFGRFLLLRDNQFGFLPGLAVGVRNLGNCAHSDRLHVGCDLRLDPDSADYEQYVPASYEEFDTRPTFYAVATKDFQFGDMVGPFAGANLGFNIGWGNGTFSDDGNYPNYNLKGTIAEGLFLGARGTFHPTLNTTFTVLAENDGWDWNAGAVGDWRGISLGVYATEIEGGDEEPGDRCVYNCLKWSVSLGYSGNIIDISRGVILRTRITELTREAQRLEMEIAERERRIRGLEAALLRAQAGELAEIEARRRALEEELQAEREAIRRAEERLRQMEEGRTPPPPTTPPASTPPTI